MALCDVRGVRQSGHNVTVTRVRSVDMPLTAWVAVALDNAVRLGVDHQAVAVGLVGSRARGAAQPDSDADILVLTPEPDLLLMNDGWITQFGAGTRLVRCEDFGGVQERRLLTPQGRVIELDIGLPGWACLQPVDPGTAEVVRGGLRIAYDPHGLLARLSAAVHES